MWRGWDGISIWHRNRSSLMIPQTCWDLQTARALHRLVRLKGVYLLDKTSKRVKFLLRRSAIIFHLMCVVGMSQQVWLCPVSPAVFFRRLQGQYPILPGAPYFHIFSNLWGWHHHGFLFPYKSPQLHRRVAFSTFCGQDVSETRAVSVFLGDLRSCHAAISHRHTVYFWVNYNDLTALPHWNHG